ncbi:MAG: putative toxin-antitoxin system toxin component, PIN family [Desulfobacterales bacterium]|nr:putative toxin-antitoxin system toxin component, PIN family [Desulfobacterales bacterium]
MVIDTNHIMSAILSTRGASSKLMDWMTKENDYFQLVISQPIWNEYTCVADWLIPASKLDEKQRILNILHSQSEWIEPDIHLDICKDISDNRFLECAVSGKADYLVTKNIKDFPPKKYKDVQIVRIAKFLKELEKIQ